MLAGLSSVFLRRLTSCVVRSGLLRGLQTVGQIMFVVRSNCLGLVGQVIYQKVACCRLRIMGTHILIPQQPKLAAVGAAWMRRSVAFSVSQGWSAKVVGPRRRTIESTYVLLGVAGSPI